MAGQATHYHCTDCSSALAMSSSRREDRFPLLFVVNLPGEKTLMEPTPSIRDRNVTRGAATLISRWPQHVQSTSRLAFLTGFTMICLSLLMVAVILYTSDYTLGAGPVARSIGGFCSLDKEFAYAGEHEGGDLVRFLTPLPRAWEFFDDAAKIFFVLIAGDTMTPDKRCAIMTAARAHNATVYLLILHDSPLSRAEVAGVGEQEAAFNGSVTILYVDAPRYFSATPLRGFWHRDVADRRLKVLAARLVTLWRFGGLSLSTDVLTLRRPRYKAKSASVDADGRVFSVHYPCHAFVFQAMRVIEKMGRYDKRFNTEAVLQVAQELYCRKTQCRNRAGHAGKCAGFMVIPRDAVCSLQHSTHSSGCVWVTFTQQDVDDNYFKGMCDVYTDS